ncbi:MAG: type II toxin-antitoxin system VapC family toxin [Planctomycetales bacterium]|nr:type II toxin-antitoxin system VapC family toxin [Planctomycetales bacterium]
MSVRFVADNSVVLAWCIEDEANEYTEGVLDSLRDGEALVPSIWPLEAANALVTAERRRRADAAKIATIVARLRALPICLVPEPPGRALSEVLSLARAQGLTAYDASYLDLAMREGLTLATQDEPLRRAMARVKVPPFRPGR